MTSGLTLFAPGSSGSVSSPIVEGILELYVQRQQEARPALRSARSQGLPRLRSYQLFAHRHSSAMRNAGVRSNPAGPHQCPQTASRPRETRPPAFRKDLSAVPSDPARPLPDLQMRVRLSQLTCRCAFLIHPQSRKEYPIAKNRNTFAKQQREQEKRRRADDKRLKRARKINGPTTSGFPGTEHPAGPLPQDRDDDSTTDPPI